jgi:hypothetical protein
MLKYQEKAGNQELEKQKLGPESRLRQRQKHAGQNIQKDTSEAKAAKSVRRMFS